MHLFLLLFMDHFSNYVELCDFQTPQRQNQFKKT